MKRFCFFVLVLCLAAGCHSKSKEEGPGAANAKAVIDLNAANHLLALKRCPEAIQSYQQFLQNNPKDAGGWNMLGLAYICDDKAPQAVDAFKQALTINSTYSDVHNNLGIAYMELKEYDLARGEFLKALQDTAYPASGPYFNLAQLAYRQQNYEESRALAKKVITLMPKQAGAHLIYAMSLEKLGETDDAVAAYRTTLQQDPNSVDACFHLADILVKQNHNCEAKEFYKRVIDADPLGDYGQKAIAALKTVQCVH